MKKAPLVEINQRRFQLTNPDKVLWPTLGLTKADLIDYYLKVAPVMEKYLAGRHLVFTRYPDGISGKWFYQKDCPAYAPEWVRTQAYWSRGSERTIHFITGADAATLAWLGNQACIEIHGWLSGAKTRSHPDWAVFDLDPAAPAAFPQAVQVAWQLKELLDQMKLGAYVKTSGGAGLHIYVPLKPIYTYQQTRAFVRTLGRMLEKHYPRQVTLARPVAARSGRVYVDYLQNGQGKTMVIPYSPRPLPEAPVSMPLDWSELKPEGHDYGIRNIDDRLKGGEDAFARILTSRQSLPDWVERMGETTE